MKMIDDQEMLKISELARAAGVSTSTIHYYVQEGLLTPPVRTSRNMAYYSTACVQEIRDIQALQSRKYLPLSVIKLLIKSRQSGQASRHIEEMRFFMEKIFQPLESDRVAGQLSTAGLAEASGLDAPTLQTLEQMGLIGGQPGADGPLYDDIDRQVAGTVAQLSRLGFRAQDLAFMRTYLEAVRDQARAIHRLFHRLPDHDRIPLNELMGLIADLKQCLDLKAYRAEAGQSHDQIEGVQP